MQTFTGFCGSMKRYRRRRRYRRLRSVVSNEENARVSMAEGKRPKFWKLRVTPKLRMTVASSVVLLKRLRNTYVGMMLWFAGGVMQLNNVAAAMFTVQLGLVTAAAAAVADDKNIIINNRELRERRPPPFRPKSPLANQQPGMRLPAPDPPPPPPPPPPTLPNNFNNNRA
ncbi:unnamed protein product [Prunus armeniaca]